jgi:hypothetical protein
MAPGPGSPTVGPAPERARGLSRSGRGRGAGAAGSASTSGTVGSGYGAAAATGVAAASSAAGACSFAAGCAGSSGTVAPLTSTSCARTVSAHARAPLELRSIRRVACRGLPFCWPSRKSATWATLSAGSSTSGARAARPAWARARTASSEMLRSSAIWA